MISTRGRRYRVLAIVLLGVFAILLLNAHSKPEYIAAAYPLLLVGGGAAIEDLGRRVGRAIPIAAATLLVAWGLLVAPLTLPVLSVPRYIAYARALGVSPRTPEKQKLAELPQFFADMQCWEELARNVSTAYLSVSAQERPTTVALVGNYGEAGALERFAGQYPLPRVISTHNAYWFWGAGDAPITTFIRLGGNKGDYAENYAAVTLAGAHTCRYAMPYENDLNIFIARGRRRPIEQDWIQAKHFE